MQLCIIGRVCVDFKTRLDCQHIIKHLEDKVLYHEAIRVLKKDYFNLQQVCQKGIHVHTLGELWVISYMNAFPLAKKKSTGYFKHNNISAKD